MTRADVPSLRDPGLPMLFLNCPFAVPGYRTLGPNGADGARGVVEHLLSVHNHDEVALIAGETGAREPEDRELGWRQAHHAYRRSEGPLVRTPLTLDGGYNAARALLARPDRPTAIFASSDLQAYGVLHAIHDHGLRLPQDIAVVSFNGTTESAHTWPPLTLVKQPVRAMAEAAITGILNDDPAEHILFDMDLVIRQSCGCSGSGRSVCPL